MPDPEEPGGRPARAPVPTGTPNVNDPALVAREYEDESRLAARRRVWHDLLDGPSSDDMVLDAVVEAGPARVLEVGAGWGDLTARIREELGASVVATDLSARMAALAHARGLPTAIADVEHLPFPHATFDAVVANAMLYHLPDLDAGVAELARVLRPAGRLVAATFGHRHLQEVWDLLEGPGIELSFHSDNGEAVLRRRFGRVRAHRGRGAVTFPDRDELRTYVASTLTRAHLADRVPADLRGPFVAHSDVAIFVGEDPRTG